MSNHGTASNVSGSFVEFECAVLRNLPRDLEAEVMDNWRDNGESLARTLRNGLSPSEEGESSILSDVATFSASAHKRFVMKDHLQSANIGWTGDNFKKVMLDRVEENVSARVIKVSRLEENSLDPEIMVALGKKHRVTSLAHFVEMLEKQSKGQEGQLLVNGMANVAYIFGTDGNIWAVNANWRAGGGYWLVEAYSLGYPREWFAGRQFLSCK